MHSEPADNEDMYGPGSDLMISLFAIAILLLGIVGVGQQFGEAENAVNALSSRVTTAAPPDKVQKVPPLKLISADQLAAEVKRRELVEAHVNELATVNADQGRTIEALNNRQDEMQNALDESAKELEALKLISSNALGAEVKKRTEAETRTNEQATANADLETTGKALKGRLAAMQNALDEATKRLEAISVQKPEGRLEILSSAFPISSLSAYLDDPSALSIMLIADDVMEIREKTTPYVPHANQLFIETSVPPELFAFMPASLDDSMAISRIYLLSAAIAQAYQQAFARGGVPLACISLVVRSFEDAPEVRREMLVEANDAVEAFSELATFYGPMDQTEAGRAVATVRVLLGAEDERPCEAGTLENLLSKLKPE